MFKKILFTLCIFMMPAFMQAACPPNRPISFRIGRIQPTNSGNKPHRSPVEAPTVYIEGNELTFETPCDGCTLQLVDENEDVVYTIIIPAETTTLYLPSDLEGIFELQIISGDWLFYAEIEL